MRDRILGRTGWEVGELGIGMWGMGGWSGSDDAQSSRVLQAGVDAGVTFFDTALAYGDGRSERLLGDLVRAKTGRRLYTASKIPPRNGRWPQPRGAVLDDAFPTDHIRRSVDQTLANLDLPSLDLIQFHVWEDDWARDERWQRAMDDLRREGLVHAVGISINRWEPANAIEALRTGAIDAVQVIYNIFDQAPEDELFPACRELGIGVIARVPFDEGSLTGTLTKESRWQEGDWRNTYFVPENLEPTIARVEALRRLVPEGMTMAELALRFILSSPDVSTVIPGMRSIANLESNVAAAEAGPLPSDLIERLRAHRWDRKPTSWSQ